MTLVLAATWNVHRCIGSDGRLDVGRVGEVVRELESDVVVLQEVECGRDLQGRSQLEEIARISGLRPVPGPIDESKRRGFGNALLTRLPVREIRNHNLAVPRLEARAALDVDLILPRAPDDLPRERAHAGGVEPTAGPVAEPAVSEKAGDGPVPQAGDRLIRVIGTHLGLFGWERRQQVMQLLSILGEDPESPTLLLGDFNEWRPADRNLAPLHERLGRVLSRPRTFPSRRPLAALDRIWCRPTVSLLHIRAHETELARLASDHLPIVAAVKL